MRIGKNNLQGNASKNNLQDNASKNNLQCKASKNNLQGNSRKLKGQQEITEQLIMSVVMLMLILMMVFFMFTWSFIDSENSAKREGFSKALFAVKSFTSSGYFTKDGVPGLLDDSKLTVYMSTQSCADLAAILGRNACINITKPLASGETAGRCTAAKYPNCNEWVLCEEICKKNRGMLGFDVPVSIHRKMDRRTDIARLDVKLEGLA